MKTLGRMIAACLTNMLQLPLWPFYGLLVLGATLYVIVLALQLADILKGGVKGRE